MERKGLPVYIQPKMKKNYKFTWRTKWISRWSGHGTLKSIVGYLQPPTEWLNQEHFDLGDSLLIVSALKLFFSFVSLFSFCCT